MKALPFWKWILNIFPKQPKRAYTKRKLNYWSNVSESRKRIKELKQNIITHKPLSQAEIEYMANQANQRQSLLSLNNNSIGDLNGQK